MPFHIELLWNIKMNNLLTILMVTLVVLTVAGGCSNQTDVIVYSANDIGSWDIFSINAGTGEQHRLTSSQCDEHYFACSPDGGKIAFVARCRNTQNELRIINADGSDERILLKNNLIDDSPISWSPDSSQVVFSLRVQKDTTHYRNLFIINIDGSDLKRLTTTPGWDSYPVWSPTGNLIAYITNNTSLNIVNAENGESRCLSDSLQYYQDISWSPDGKEIVFVAPNPAHVLYKISINNGELTMILHGPPSDTWDQPQWSPDGTKIAFVSNNDIFVVPSEGGEAQQLTFSSEYEQNPIWSRSGEKIAFSYIEGVNTNTGTNEDLYIMNKDGSDQINLTNTPEINEDFPEFLNK